MRRIIKFLLILTFLSPATCFCGIYWSASDSYTPPPEPGGGETYYVDGNNGDDSYDGLYATYQGGTSGPKKTLNSVNIVGDHRGRRILILAGTYYESLSFTNSGSHTYGTSEDEREIWAAYGDGEVIIEGRSLSQNLETWSVYSGSVYQCAMSANSDGTYVRWIVVDDDYESYQMVDSLGAVDDEGEWYYSASTKVLYVYQPSGVTLSTSSILVGEDDAYGGSVIRLYTSGSSTPQYLSFYNLTLQCAPEYGVIADGGNNHIVLDHLVCQYNGKGGAHIRATNSEITKCHIQHNVMRNWPRGTWGGGSGSYGVGVYGGWPFGVGFSTGGDDSTLSGCYVHDNGGEGIGAYGSGGGIDGVVFEDNLSINNWSMMMYADNATNFVGRRNFLYVSPFSENSEKVWGGLDDACTARAYGRITGTGFAFAEESYTPYTCDNTGNAFYNNIIVGTKYGIENLTEQSNCGIRNSSAISNTVILTEASYSDLSGGGIGNQPSGLRWGSDTTYDYSVNLTNNIFVSKEDSQYVGYIADGSETALTVSYNLWFHSGETPSQNVWYTGGSVVSFSSFQTTHSATNDVNQNPQIDDPGYTSTRRTEILALTGIDINDYAPTVSTPTGAQLESPFNTDFDGNSRENYTLGAIEYASTNQTTVSGVSLSGVTFGGN